MSTEKLIELVKRYPIVYDLSDGDYKNTRKKDKVWDEIAVELADEEAGEKPGENAKRRFKNLRDTLGRLIRNNRTRTGQAADPKKKWAYWDQMQFFRPFMCFAKTTSNVPKKKRPVDHRNEGSDRNEDKENEAVDEEISEETQETEEERTMFTTPMLSAASTSKRKRKHESVSSVDTLVNYFQSKKKTEMDDIELLFLAHAKTVKTFSKKRQILAKMHVAEVIMQEELTNFNEKSACPSSDTHILDVANKSILQNPNSKDTCNLPSTNSYESLMSKFRSSNTSTAHQSSIQQTDTQPPQDTPEDDEDTCNLPSTNSYENLMSEKPYDVPATGVELSDLKPSISSSNTSTAHQSSIQQTDSQPPQDTPEDDIVVLINETLQEAVDRGAISLSSYVTVYSPNANE